MFFFAGISLLIFYRFYRWIKIVNLRIYLSNQGHCITMATSVYKKNWFPRKQRNLLLWQPGCDLLMPRATLANVRLYLENHCCLLAVLYTTKTHFCKYDNPESVTCHFRANNICQIKIRFIFFSFNECSEEKQGKNRR